MRTTTLQGWQGLSLAADINDAGAGPTVILLHGGGQTRHAWSGAARQLAAQGYRTIAYDARGHGGSGWAEDGNYTTDALVADLKAIVAALPAPPALVGASMGGITALTAIGETDTPLASALVLVDVAPTIERRGVEAIRRFMTANPGGFASLEAAADAVAAYNPSRPRPKDPSGLKKNLRLGEDGRLYWHWDPRIIAGSQEEHVAYLQAYETRMSNAARGIRVPTLLVRGSQSDVVSPEGAKHLQQLIPQAEIADIAGAGHMVAGDRNDAFNDAVIGFLNRSLRG
ncbi:alpha/beta hydrolase [Solimonas sp. K1W22B-7]|uniref:alpha/beta fold hydrolase n=1 Tax=Solimonas sp. K1W22B-7 TaxID=2303331 RepID=UPI000E32F98A|nr:alpha/beta hydrolase [Solimonas sp. K1W22B-7]AXQ28688.1 alpha/beta hydrolase [Solimonas sp. K1W22B-7]